MTNQQELHEWLILYHINKLSPLQIQQLYEEYTTTDAIINFLLSSESISLEVKQALKTPPMEKIKKDFDWQDQPNHYIIPLSSTHYPKLLKHTVAPPPIIYLKGNPNVLSQPQIAIVGSRKATPHGLKNAYDFGFNLSLNHLIITSGLALGIDGAAHQGAVDANQSTVAVLGSGIEKIYPKKHKELAHKIIEKGAIISEFPIYSEPYRNNFPRRNRVISGLSLATLVIEAGLCSGSLITAKQAVEQNREVFALPGSVQNTNKRGTHHLIQNGAYLIEKYQDILIMLKLSTTYSEAIIEKKPTDLDQSCQNLLECVDFAVTNINDIYKMCELPFKTVNYILLNLEMQNYIKKVTGGYIRVK
jgi:DNA processing protein